MISQSQCMLLKAINASLFEMDFINPSDDCLKEIEVEAEFQAVIGLISPVLPVQDKKIEQSKACYMRMLYEQDKLIKCFDAAQIPCVILKGTSAAIYYPKPYLRSMGDIDILVPQNRFLESTVLLEKNGYIYDHGKEQDELLSDVRELAYIKNGIIIELHQRFSSSGVDIDDILEDAISRRTICNLNGYSFPVLPQLENGLTLLGHIHQHLKNNELGLRQIIDWEMFVHSFTDVDTWNLEFIPLLKKSGLLSLAAYVTRLCSKYLGLSSTVCFDVEVDDNLIDQLLEAVLNDGNFGRRIYSNKDFDEIKIISTSRDMKYGGLFNYFTRIGLASSSFCRKHSSIRIIAFIFGFFRQLSMGICFVFKEKNAGKKISDVRKMYKMLKKRRELYRKIGIRI